MRTLPKAKSDRIRKAEPPRLIEVPPTTLIGLGKDMPAVVLPWPEAPNVRPSELVPLNERSKVPKKPETVTEPLKETVSALAFTGQKVRIEKAMASMQGLSMMKLSLLHEKL